MHMTPPTPMTISQWANNYFITPKIVKEDVITAKIVKEDLISFELTTRKKSNIKFGQYIYNHQTPHEWTFYEAISEGVFVINKEINWNTTFIEYMGSIFLVDSLEGSSRIDATGKISQVTVARTTLNRAENNPPKMRKITVIL